MAIQPIGCNVLLAPVEQEEKTAAGLYRPDTADNKGSQEATVVAVGDDAKVAVGDRVLYKKFSGDEFSYDNKEYVIVKNDDVIAVLA